MTRLELAIQEALRLESPTQITSRVAKADLEFAGEQVWAGDRIALLIGSANRDESIFAQASQFDLQRSLTASASALTFGSGGKRCPGAWLSTNVIGSTLQVFLEDIQDLALDTQELRWQENLESRRLVDLPVRLKF
jgi:cytochrome P450